MTEPSTVDDEVSRAFAAEEMRMYQGRIADVDKRIAEFQALRDKHLKCIGHLRAQLGLQPF